MGNYFESKATSGLCQPIIALMPPHDTYIETHLGAHRYPQVDVAVALAIAIP